MVAIFGTQLNGDLQILHRGIRFAREAIEGRHRVDNVIGFRRGLASAIKVLARFVPPAEIHERDALRVVFFCRFGGRCRGAGNPLVADAHVNQSAISQFLARPFQYALEGLLRALKFLLLKEAPKPLRTPSVGLVSRGLRDLERTFALPTAAKLLFANCLCPFCEDARLGLLDVSRVHLADCESGT